MGLLMRMRSILGSLAVVTVVFALAASAPQPASAAKLKTILRAVLIPEDAQYLAHKRWRSEEERYWHDYRAGLEEQRPERGIGPDEARRYEELSYREHHMQEERYWRDYRAGFGRGRAYEPYEPRRGD